MGSGSSGARSPGTEKCRKGFILSQEQGQEKAQGMCLLSTQGDGLGPQGSAVSRPQVTQHARGHRPVSGEQHSGSVFSTPLPGEGVTTQKEKDGPAPTPAPCPLATHHVSTPGPPVTTWPGQCCSQTHHRISPASWSHTSVVSRGRWRDAGGGRAPLPTSACFPLCLLPGSR